MRLKISLIFTFCLFILFSTFSYSGVNVGASIGGYHSYEDGSYYRAGFYAGAYAYTNYMSYTKAYARCVLVQPKMEFVPFN